MEGALSRRGAGQSEGFEEACHCRGGVALRESEGEAREGRIEEKEE